MWEMLFKQLGIKPEEVKKQADEIRTLVLNFDAKLNTIIAMLESDKKDIH